MLSFPRENEPASRVNYLLKTKFSTSAFEKVPEKRCSRDYLPEIDYYFDVAKGIVIQANRESGEVVNFSLHRSNAASELMATIKNCQR